jgi:hypothetical protein
VNRFGLTGICGPSLYIRQDKHSTSRPIFTWPIRLGGNRPALQKLLGLNCPLPGIIIAHDGAHAQRFDDL